MGEDMIAGWLEARKPTVKPEGGKSIQEISEEVIDSLQASEKEAQDIEERTTLSFQKNDDFLVMRGGTIRAHLKDCARVLSSFSEKPVKGEGLRSLAVRAVNSIYIEDYWVPILKNGKQTKFTDGSFDKAVHIMTPQGPRNALKRIHYVENPTLIFNLLIMTTDKSTITQADIERIMEYGCIHGYAGERGDGEGRYNYEVTLIGGKAAHSMAALSK
jgi:hypothetical protein